MNIIVKQYLPSCKQKYIFNNYKHLSTYRTYKPNIPAYLHDRPRSVVIHCLDRMSKVNRYTVQDCTEGVFEVLKDTGKKHTVNFGMTTENNMPSCTCMDWQRHQIPCKHFFSVFVNRPNWQWESLPTTYLQGPYLSMDTMALTTHVGFTMAESHGNDAEQAYEVRDDQSCSEEQEHTMQSSVTDQSSISETPQNNDDQAHKDSLSNTVYICNSYTGQLGNRDLLLNKPLPTYVIFADISQDSWRKTQDNTQTN